MGRAFFREPGGEPGEFVPGEFARQSIGMDFDWRQRRFRLVGPQYVDGVALKRHQFGSDLFGGSLQSLDVADGMQPGVESDPRALAEIIPHPDWRWRFDQAFDGEDRHVDLTAHL